MEFSENGEGGQMARPVATPSISQPIASPARDRKLHLGHFAFMRAVVQGIDTRASWERYLRVEGDHDDLRNVKKTIAWMRDAFAAAAKRSHRYGTARLVLIDVASIPEGAAQFPSLEDFVADQGLDDFSESEQLEAYQEHYGNATQRQSRRGRLIARQLDALFWLEKLVAQPPLSGDALASWLHPDLVKRLEGEGLFTVRQLVERINGIGKRWWASIPAIGVNKATRILDWCRAHEATLGVTIGAHVAVARSKLYDHELARIVPRATAIVPLEKFIVPADLDGTQGLYRAPQRLCLMRATNDYQAVLTWIRTRRGVSESQRAAIKKTRGIDTAAIEAPMDWLQYLSHTQRAYLKEAERFILWAVVQRQKPLSSMTLEDCEAYRSFLANPSPADLWCGPRAREKWSPLWRPFEGPLSVSAQKHAVTILKSLYKFLVDQCYLIGNPWNGVIQPRSAPRMNTGRSFTASQWAFIEGQLGQLPASSASCRLRFALHLLYATGLRLSEVVQATVDDLNWVSYPAGEDNEEPVEGWELRVVGKGGKIRIVPVPLDVIGELSLYLAARGFDRDPEHAENRGTFLLGKAVDLAERAPWAHADRHDVDPKEGIADATFYRQIKRFFTDCAQAMMYIDAKGAQRLAAASTHWMRHTHGSHSVAAGTPLDIVQQNLGHASLNTTTIYTTSEERRRMKAMGKFWDKCATR